MPIGHVREDQRAPAGESAARPEPRPAARPRKRRSGRHSPGRLICATALLATSACTRFDVVHVGLASDEDPSGTLQPQGAPLQDTTKQGQPSSPSDHP
jgi:hypothetical protein